MSLVVVSVGTDKHPFDRMIEWIDSCDLPDVEFIIQSGTSKKSQRWESSDLIPHDELLHLFTTCAAVVSHGGPSTVMDARMVGKKPIVLPRNPEYGEHVDGHQMAFADHMAEFGVSQVVTTKNELVASIAEAIAQPALYAVAKSNGVLPGVVGVGKVLDDLLGVTTPISDPSSVPEDAGKV